MDWPSSATRKMQSKAGYAYTQRGPWNFGIDGIFVTIKNLKTNKTLTIADDGTVIEKELVENDKTQLWIKGQSKKGEIFQN